ncbi:MAG TPA: hypothetical protein VKF40_04410 [Burkholderiales bacterium]|nr:hypothetical protein [Burkholderiales bacterium]
MNEPQPISPRARLQELLAIPESKRTDAEWDELNELEIMLAAGNRGGAPQQGGRGNAPAPGGHSRPGGGQHHGKNPPRKFHQRPPRRDGR